MLSPVPYGLGQLIYDEHVTASNVPEPPGID